MSISLSTAPQSSSIYNYLLPDLWEICGSYLPKSEAFNFWAAVEDNPEKGFARTSATVYRLFKEKIKSLPPENPLKDWFHLHSIYQKNVHGWAIDECVLLRDVDSVLNVTDNQVITRERIMKRRRFQYYVCDLSETTGRIVSKVPLGTPQRMPQAIIALATHEFAMMGFAYKKKYINVNWYSRIGVWKLQPSEESGSSKIYKCMVQSETLESPLSLKPLTQNRLVCSLMYDKIKIFDHNLKELIEFSPTDSFKCVEPLPDGRIVTLGYNKISVWSLLEVGSSLVASADTNESCMIGEYVFSAVLQDGQLVFAVNNIATFPYFCIYDIAGSGDKVFYPLEKNERIYSVSVLSTGQIACGISNPDRLAEYVKVWPPDHSNKPRTVLWGGWEQAPFSDAGMAFSDCSLGFHIAQPVLDDDYLEPRIKIPKNAVKKPVQQEGCCPIL